ncbi:MAG: MFS transporter [Gaiella sp.]
MRALPRSAFGPFAGFLAFGVLWGAWAVSVPLVQQATDASDGALGLGLLGVGLGTLPAMVLIGPRIDHSGPGVMPWALALLAVTALGPALANSVLVLWLTLLVWGAAAGAVDVSINAAAAEVEARTGARVMQLAHALFSLGVLVGAVGGGAARQFGAGRAAILAGAAICLLLAALANRDARALNRGPAPLGPPGFKLRWHVVALGLVCLVAFLVEGGIESWSALYMERELDTGPLLGALGPGAYAIAMVSGRLAGQVVTGRVAERRLLFGGGLISAAGLLVAAAAPAPAVAIVGFFVAGAGVSVAAPVAFSAAGRVVDEGERGSAVATVTTMGYAGLLIGPGLAGGVSEAAGLRGTFVALALVALVLVVAAPRLRLA